MKRGIPNEGDAARLALDSRNRAAAEFLRDAGRPLHVDELAERIVDRDAAIVDPSEYDREFERVRLSLHHDHLPKLAAAGVIEYDPDENVADYRDGEAVEAEWVRPEGFGELLSRSGIGRPDDENAVGVIEGRESVIEHGRRLADEADEELFCMYVTPDLLEAGCVRRAEDAAERGVDISLGSANRDVLDLARERLPEATLWEPQLDWLNAPTRSPKVGRLVLADREAVMLALLDEDGSETAVIGDGEDNPLVVLVRELLGPRLDHLDYQSGDHRSGLRCEK